MNASHTRPTVFTPRWLAAGGAVVLAGVIGIALLLQHGGSAACAAPPTGNATRTGKATFYDLGGGTGNCSFRGAPADDLFVALGNSEYSGAAACGSYLDVTGPKGKVRVKVIDRCPECEPGHLDLSRTAFKKIANEVQGIVPIKYKAVLNPATPGPVSVRIKEGSSQFWFAVLIDNHANPLTSVKVKSKGGGLRSAQRADFNFWIIEGGAGPGPFSIQMTDVYGHQATATDVRLQPEQIQSTSVRLTRGGTGAVAAGADEPRRAPKKRSPAPSTSRPGTVKAPAAVAKSAAARPAATPPGVLAAPGAVLPETSPSPPTAVELAAAKSTCG